MKIKIPKCMSTQHPDNVNPPFFAENMELGGEDEIQEAYYAFSHLGCDEQMWDCEGKEVDNYVVKKLLTKYGHFFSEKRIGEDLFITLRVPNPKVERGEAKILLETLESIPRSFDAARLFYGHELPPIFEVILPMTTTAGCVDRVYKYYSDFVSGKENKSLGPNGMKIAEWIGEFHPKKINVIPLFEDMPHMLNAHKITQEYLEGKDIKHQRVFLARSDPALNYGLVSAVLSNKIALQRIHEMSKETGIRIYPIIGAGPAPFRGNLRPQTVENVMEEYPSAHTFTIQSAFKYDNPPEDVAKSIKKIKNAETALPHDIDEETSANIIERYSAEYKEQVISLADTINRVAKYIPRRRKRKLHIGLFGYSRNIEGVNLPRAITFTSALYSIGVPPEILGLNALEDADFDFLKKTYVHFEDDLKDALGYCDLESPFLPEKVKKAVEGLPFDFETDEEHRKFTQRITDSLRKGEGNGIRENVLGAANIRKFLG